MLELAAMTMNEMPVEGVERAAVRFAGGLDARLLIVSFRKKSLLFVIMCAGLVDNHSAYSRSLYSSKINFILFQMLLLLHISF